MSVAKCVACGDAKRKAAPYDLIVEPLGYPSGGLVCGAAGCDQPALIWLTAWEAAEYRAGRRVFSLTGRAPKIRVGDTARALPFEPLLHGFKDRSPRQRDRRDWGSVPSPATPADHPAAD